MTEAPATKTHAAKAVLQAAPAKPGKNAAAKAAQGEPAPAEGATTKTTTSKTAKPPRTNAAAKRVPAPSGAKTSPDDGPERALVDVPKRDSWSTETRRKIPEKKARKTRAVSRQAASFDSVAERLGVELPDSLVRMWSSPPRLGSRLYEPEGRPDSTMSLGAAVEALGTSAQPVPSGLVPITYVDDRSMACVVCRPMEGDAFGPTGRVVRWHLDDIPVAHQAAMLDVDAESYTDSLVEEFGRVWQAGYDGMARVAARYQAEFVGKGVTPKAHNLRPFQLACQNVIIGLAAMRHDAVIDGLSVEYWQTCEVPHVATNEGNRALSALMLCDAFQAGGTMEISFAKHPEQRVPAALRRYGRTLGIELGGEVENGASISPSEARQLFLAVTPMPDGLREVAMQAIDSGLVSPERLCYSLLSPIWPAIELEFILRCSNRAASILEGGADVEDRDARLAELEVARAAAMVGTLYRRLDSIDGAGGGGDGAARVFEDTSHGVTWRVIGDHGAVEFMGVPPGPIPWLADGEIGTEATNDRLVVVPRAHPIVDDVRTLDALGADGPALLVVPRGTAVPLETPVLVCTDRLSELDARVVRNLETSQLVRA